VGEELAVKDSDLVDWLRITNHALREGKPLAYFAQEVRGMQRVLAELARREVRRINLKKRPRA